MKTRLISSIHSHSLSHGFTIGFYFSRCARTLLSRQKLRQRFDEMSPRTEKHSSHKVCCRNTGSAFDDLESARRLHEPVAVLATTIRCNIVPMYHVFATIMGDPRKR